SNDGEKISEKLQAAMENARKNQEAGYSPGAGLKTADEQSDAAYADLINTCIDQQGISLSSDEVDGLAKGGTMWEDGQKAKKGKGLFGDMVDVFKALGGGAHITRRDDGSI
ncbi:unnamed protein product, partial [Heterosigma akashiwo]